MTFRSAALIVLLLSAWPAPSWGQAAPPRFMINDVDVAASASPLLQNGVLMLPADVVARAFGATTVWNASAGTLTIAGASGIVVRLAAGQAQAKSGDAEVSLPAAPVVRDGVLWAPSAAVLRALGAYVVDDTDGRTTYALAQVTAVSWRVQGDGLAVQVVTTGPVRAAAHVLHRPERLVLDLAGAVARLHESTQDIGSAGVTRVRGGQFQVRPYVTRLVFDLDHAVSFAVTARPGAVALVLGDAGRAAAAPGASAPAAPAASPVPPSAPPIPSAGGGSVPAVAEPPHEAGIAPEPVALPPLPEFADRAGAFHVQTVSYDDQGRSGRITIRASQRLTYAIHQFVYPDRLAIDISGGVYLARRHDIEVSSDAVRNVIVSQFQLSPNLTRVLVHLHRKMPYGASVTEGGRTLTVTLGDPGRRLARGSNVIIDPGHGGLDGGAVGPSGLREADVALAIGRFVRQALVSQGIPAALTRGEDTTVPLEERPDLAQREGGMLFVSIHANASRGVGTAGTETYYKTPESQPLARVVQAEVVRALGEPDRGIRAADFYVLVNTPMPSVLVETAFISNPDEEAMLRDPAVQRRIADAIARAIAKFVAADRGAPAAP